AHRRKSSAARCGRATASSSPSRPRTRPPARASRRRASSGPAAGRPVASSVPALHGITRVYHLGDIEVRALAGVDLAIASGEFLAIMGASGSGKSTLMNLLGCLDRPSSGRYLFEGVDVAELTGPGLARIRSERIGFVFQSFNLLARTSALENVALPLFYADGGPARRSERRGRGRHARRATPTAGPRDGLSGGPGPGRRSARSGSPSASGTRRASSRAASSSGSRSPGP